MSDSGPTWVEPDAQVNDVWSRGPANLRDRVHLLGSIHAANLTLGNGVTIDGDQDRSPVFDPVASLSWTVQFPDSSPTDVNLDPPNKRSIGPGHYGQVRLGGNGAELSLKSGVYYIETLTLESLSKIWLDQSSGPVIIYVASVSAFRGTFAALDGSEPDLLVGYLGNNPIYVEAKYQGALVAPSAPITIRSVGVSHVGFFAGSSINLDAHATVNYRAPNAVVTAARPDEKTCRSLIALRSDLSGSAQAQQYAEDLARYCGICKSKLDSDSDGTPDCVDGCPYDANKTSPGVSGCGSSDAQSDGDGVPDGIDECDHDSRNVFLGTCGCVGQTNLRPSGTRCFDPLCPSQTNPTCDGHGICGSINCLPQPDCVPVMVHGIGYFICGGAVPPGQGPAIPKTQQGAFDACAAQGLIPAQVDTYEQNQLIRTLLKSYGISNAWLGGNQRSVAGVWRWAKLGSFDGDVFWSGGVSGTSIGKFADWSNGHPGSNACMAMQSVDGRWTDLDCSLTLPFVCENPPAQNTREIGKTAISDQPTPLSNCVPESGGSAPLPGPGHIDELLSQYAQADAGVFTGAAALPPANGSSCPPSDLAQVCPLTSIKTLMCADGVTECDCAAENALRTKDQGDICNEKFGSGYVCRVTKNDLNCVALDAGDPDCPAKARCGVPDCSKGAPKSPNRCDQIDICSNGSDEFTFKGPDDGSDLTPQTIVPDQFFASPPDKTQSQQYYDEPDSQKTGKEHVWCRLGPQDPNKVQPGNADMNKQGQSGASSPIHVSFQPDLVFEANANPLAFGQSDIVLNAKASMSARVDLAASVLAPDGVGIEVFYAGIGIAADRCRVNTNVSARRSAS